MGSFDIGGKVALVTGAARGIGFATAGALHQRGAAVVIVDLDARDAQRAAQAIGPRAIGFGADVSDLAAMQRVVTQTVERHGALDIVVANAGIAPKPSSVRTMHPGLFDRVIEVNLLGVHRTVSAALPQVVAGGGHVVVTSSVYAFINGVLLAPYAMSKAAVEQFGRALRAELVHHGASASVAYFGYIDTAIVRGGVAEPPGRSLKARFPRGLLAPIGPDVAAAAIVRGIERRAPRIVAPRRWIPMSILRGLVNPLLDHRTERNAMIQAIVRDADQVDPDVVSRV
ncbi:short-chain dehydrogenase/reductase [Solirubrobacter ginsenosidimutans]|uniref:Short-chain dehydrogenase/reductase n=1 Tax=Solirubrobacter ginsenosidimutans TaxID=490573 RepID=A0A9X3S4Y4_9ACTN|nr:short-chain dehydrogenase/reductase [Solirubrobacter ginsenosidimutans]MDA0167160.1 short-chain dehydrogenase/reductase [Solirubrobacter ginsenosidimutans]